MTLQDAEIFLKENAARLRRLGERKDTSLGFNAFALVSDTYYRENFHSDIIRAILDPHSGHGEGALFLRKFVDFISAEARSSASRLWRTRSKTWLSVMRFWSSAKKDASTSRSRRLTGQSSSRIKSMAQATWNVRSRVTLKTAAKTTKRLLPSCISRRP